MKALFKTGCWLKCFRSSEMDCSEILCVRFSNPEWSTLLLDFLYMVWIKRYLHLNTNVENSCVNWNKLGIIDCSKIEFYRSIIPPPPHPAPIHKDERKH